MAIEVTGLAITAVKAMRLRSVQSLVFDRHGVRENRRFFLIDADNQMVNAKHLGALQTIVADYHDARRRLSLSFPDGRVLEGEVALDEEVMTQFYGEPMSAKLVRGEWSE